MIHKVTIDMDRICGCDPKEDKLRVNLPTDGDDKAFLQVNCTKCGANTMTPWGKLAESGKLLINFKG